MSIKVGDRLDFKKFRWTITEATKNWRTGGMDYKYRVHRKYFNAWVPLSNTKCTYTIMGWRWNFLKQQLKKQPNYNYNMSLWSNSPK